MNEITKDLVGTNPTNQPKLKEQEPQEEVSKVYLTGGHVDGFLKAAGLFTVPGFDGSAPLAKITLEDVFPEKFTAKSSESETEEKTELKPYVEEIRAKIENALAAGTFDIITGESHVPDIVFSDQQIKKLVIDSGSSREVNPVLTAMVSYIEQEVRNKSSINTFMIEAYLERKPELAGFEMNFHSMERRVEMAISVLKGCYMMAGYVQPFDFDVARSRDVKGKDGFSEKVQALLEALEISMVFLVRALKFFGVKRIPTGAYDETGFATNIHVKEILELEETNPAEEKIDQKAVIKLIVQIQLLINSIELTLNKFNPDYSYEQTAELMAYDKE